MVSLEVTKSADRNYIFYGLSNRIKYIITITNTGTETAKFVKFRDILGEGLRFIPGTFTLNECKQGVLRVDKFITLGQIPPGGNLVITFDVELREGIDLAEAINQAEVTYCDGMQVETVLSNLLIIPIIKLDVCIQKTVDKCKANVGDVVAYSIQVRNKSNLPINNVILYDNLPAELQILPGTVLIDLKPQYIGDLSQGILLGTINAFASVLLSFQAKIMQYPPNGLLINTARVEYEYSIVIDGVVTTSVGEACTDPVITKVCNKVITC